MIFTCPISRQQTQNQLLVLILLALAGWIFFIDKPVYNDDVTYLEFSERFSDVKSFYTTPYYLFGKKYENIIDGSHPPLTAFINFLVYKIYPDAEEITFHSVYYLFAVGALVFTYLVSLRFSKHPFLITICFLFSPPFFIQAQSLMTDIVLYCFIFGSLFFFVKAVDLEKRAYLFWAVLMFSLALGAGFQAIIFYAAFFIYGCVRSPRKPSYFFIMWLALLPSFLWFAYHFSLIDQGPNPFNQSYFDWTYKREKIIYYISQISLAYLCPIGLILAVLNRSHKKTIIAAGIFAWIFYHFMRGHSLDSYSVLQKWTLYVSGFFSILGLGLIGKRGWEYSRENATANKWDYLLLATMIFIYLGICITFTQFGASRYLLPIMPFFLILILKESPSPGKAAARITIGLCVFVSFQSALAEYRFADFYRKFPKVADRYIENKQKTWFVGYLGFRYYMKRAGFKMIQLDSIPDPEDRIIEPTTLARLEVALIQYPTKIKKNLTVDQPGTLLKMLNYEAHAGFLGQHWGLLPFWPQNTPMDRIRIHEVIPKPTPFNLLGPQKGLSFPGSVQPEIKTSGDDVREAVPTNLGHPFAFWFTPGKDCRLEFGFAAQWNPRTVKSPGVGLTTFKIYAGINGERDLIFQRSVEPWKENTPGAWQQAEIDLRGYRNQLLKLELDTDNRANVTAFWSSLNLIEEETIRLE